MAEGPKRSTGAIEEAMSEAAACRVALCPVSMVLTAVGEVRPEVVDHIVRAGREFLLAMKEVLDARASASAEPRHLERIEVE